MTPIWSADSSSSKQRNLAGAAPQPEPSQEQSLEPPPDLPEESRPVHTAVSVYKDPDQVIASPRKAESQGINPSQDSVSTRSGHRSLGSNTSPRKDKGKSKETERADIEQLKGSSGEISSPATNIVVPQATIMPPPLRMTKKLRRRVEKKQVANPSRVAETSVPQSQEATQTNDSQESQHQGMMVHSVSVFDTNDLCLLSVQQIVLVSDNSGSSLNLSNSNRTASSDLSWIHPSLENRLKKLESSASMESVLSEQVADLHIEVEHLKSDLEKVSNQLSEVQTRNSELYEENTKLRVENAEIRKENADQLVGSSVNCTYLYLKISFCF